MTQSPEPHRPSNGAPRGVPAVLLMVWRFCAGPLWTVLKYVFAALYFVLDETGQHVKRLAARLKPLQWYFRQIKMVRYLLTRHGLRSGFSLVRAVTPFATLPFLIIPGLVLLPLKVFLMLYILTKPLLCLAGIIAAKFFGAVFIKNTWDILRPVARRNSWLAFADNYWQMLEAWAKGLMYDLKQRITSLPGYALVRDQVRAVVLWLKPYFVALGRRVQVMMRALLRRIWQRVSGRGAN